jgi:hypothetical protein
MGSVGSLKKFLDGPPFGAAGQASYHERTLDLAQIGSADQLDSDAIGITNDSEAARGMSNTCATGPMAPRPTSAGIQRRDLA